jgi:hypothetical protein
MNLLSVSKLIIAVLSLWLSGCATEPPVKAVEDGALVAGTVAFGRAVTLLTGPSSRSYEPMLNFFELINRDTQERYRVTIGSEDKHFAFSIPPGPYELSRVQVGEGPFLSMADLNVQFDLAADGALYLGTWRFGVETPQYGRKMLLSVVNDPLERQSAVREASARFPTIEPGRLQETTLTPDTVEVRLYEVMPYPRWPKYFRRHLW